MHKIFISFVFREQKEKQEAKDRYWKVNIVLDVSRALAHVFSFSFVSYTLRERQIRLNQTCPALQRSARNAKLPPQRGKLKPKVRHLPKIEILHPLATDIDSYSFFPSPVERAKAVEAAKAAQASKR